MHAFINAFIAIVLLEVSVEDLQVEVIDPHGVGTFGGFDEIFWARLAPHHPVLYETTENKLVLYDRVIMAPMSGTSLLKFQAKDHSIMSPQRDVKCYSPILRAFTEFTRGAFQHAEREKGTLQVIFNLRQPYWRYDEKSKKHVLVPVYRALNDGERVIYGLKTLLQHEPIEISSVDLGSFTMNDAMDLMRHTDILIGVHGAALVWSMFLPEGAGLIELFGGDRGESNRHYPNIAAMSRLLYESVVLKTEQSRSLRCDDACLEFLTRLIAEMAGRIRRARQV